MRAGLLILVAGCGFRVDGAQTDDGPVDDGRPDDAHVTTDAHVTVDASADAPTCPVGFAPVAGAPAASRYRTFGGQTWDSAVMTCANLGTHLLQLDTQGEASALYQLIDAATTGVGDTHIYRVVGKRNRAVTPNTWLALDGVTPLTFLPWGVGEPTSGATEDCMSLRTESNPTLKVIGADLCATLHEFACECE